MASEDVREFGLGAICYGSLSFGEQGIEVRFGSRLQNSRR